MTIAFSDHATPWSVLWHHETELTLFPDANATESVGPPLPHGCEDDSGCHIVPQKSYETSRLFDVRPPVPFSKGGDQGVSTDCDSVMSAKGRSRHGGPTLAETPFPRMTVARHIAKSVKQWIEGSGGAWILSNGDTVRYENLILMRMENVSEGSWQIILGYYPPIGCMSQDTHAHDTLTLLLSPDSHPTGPRQMALDGHHLHKSIHIVRDVCVSIQVMVRAPNIRNLRTFPFPCLLDALSGCFPITVRQSATATAGITGSMSKTHGTLSAAPVLRQRHWLPAFVHKLRRRASLIVIHSSEGSGILPTKQHHHHRHHTIRRPDVNASQAQG
ncbi:hypothetical protein NM688_g6967 [Phlebia brevispora]|uniref:Uncharacterized protein n=1 Tax=Phlebia brevispora TaxID=194682 RepID=A0ACC1SAH5_9APHY|nr:hypothetical protein NM688_g6967 [Phlebia brevispora]